MPRRASTNSKQTRQQDTNQSAGGAGETRGRKVSGNRSASRRSEARDTSRSNRSKKTGAKSSEKTDMRSRAKKR